METEQQTQKMKYVTLEEGIDFRKIASLMTEAGYQMNHATARNVLMMALGKLVQFLSNKLEVQLTEEQIEEVLKSQHVHEALCDILYEAHQRIETENC